MQKISGSKAFEMYDEVLDEVYGDFMGSYPASQVLKAVDPIAYREGFLDYVDGLEEDGYEVVEV